MQPKNNEFMNLILKKGASKEEIKAIEEKLLLLTGKKKMEAKKYSGTIQLKEDPLVIQKKLRNEWE